MLDGAFQHVGQDLHIAMGVLAKAHRWSNIVLIDHAQSTETHVRRVIVLRKTEAEVRIQPSVVGMAPLCRFPDNQHLSFTSASQMRSTRKGFKPPRWCSAPPAPRP